MTLDSNINPYFDDYSELKQFYKILFRPGYAVQARELTQIQSLLQNQISKFGSHVFKNGSMVLGGETDIDLNYSYVKLQPQYSGVDIDISSFVGGKVYGKTSGAIATVMQIAAADGTDPNTLFVKYQSGISTKTVSVNTTLNSRRITLASGNVEDYLVVGQKIAGANIPANSSIVRVNPTLQEAYINSGAQGTATGIVCLLTTSNVFTDNEVIALVDETVGTELSYVQAQALTATGQGSSVHINSGIFYALGYFALVNKQTLILDKYTNTPSYKVGVFATESIVTADDDSSLNDPANGFSNYNAPGADRYKIDMVLSKYTLTETTGSNFIELIRLSSGILQKKVENSLYSELEKTLARRTFDESGNYTTKLFPIVVKEHFNDGTNSGVYTYAEGGDEAKLAIGLEAGKAYVKGFEIQKIATEYVAMDKGRDTRTIQNDVIYSGNGAYTFVDHVLGTFDITSYSTVLLKNAVHNGTDTTAGTQVGTAKIRGFEYYSGTRGTTAAVYKLYLYDIVMTGSYKFATDVKSIVATGTPASLSDTVLVSGEAIIYDSNKNIAVFSLPNIASKTLKVGGNSDTTYSVRRYYTGSLTATQITLTAGSNEVFKPYSAGNYHLTTSAGTVIDLSASGNSVVLGGSPTGKQATITVNGGSGAVKIIAPLTKTLGQEKTKTLTARSQSIAAGSTLALDRADIFRVNSILEGAVDVTDRYNLDDGQRDNAYVLGSLTLKTGATAPTGTLTVSYDYFEHGTGDYFSVDSYNGVIDYSDIPSFTASTGTTYELRDCLDFRPRTNNSGTGYSVLTEQAVSTDAITFDYEHYLPRIDRVYLDFLGNFGVIRGISDINPKSPSAPSDAMAIYDVLIPAYTFSTTDVKAVYIENKNYTMRDIGKLEKRIENLEYYTALNMLEKDTASLFMDDGTGMNRFKNGFVVDNFGSEQVADTASAEYNASISPTDHFARPRFYQGSVKLELNTSSSTGYQQTGDLVTLPYSHVKFIDQPYNSRVENVNPFDVYSWRGLVRLNPASDDWRDTTNAPDKVLNTTNSATSTVINSYLAPDEMTMTTEESRIMNIKTRPSGLNADSSIRAQQNRIFNRYWTEWQDVWTGRKDAASSAIFQKVITNRLASQGITVDPNSTWSLNGTNISVEGRQVVNDRVIDNSIVPFIRSREITFTATGLKPNTRVYPFFDNSSVSAFCKPSAGNYGDPLYTDASGAIIGIYAIPNTDLIKFRTGSRLFRLTDDSTNGGAGTTVADAIYVASGILETRQSDVISTKIAIAGIRYTDPLAQTFVVDMNGGVFITKIDIFFKTKSTNNTPIKLQIRNVENGVPGSVIVPLSEVVLYPDSITETVDGSTATTFTFDSPVYLQDATEYAIVLLANSSEYTIWTAKVGETQYNTENLISKQPYTGVLLKSQNASTWTADQEQDLKFTIYRASFTTATNALVVLNNEAIPTRLLESTPFFTTNGSNIVFVAHPLNGMVDGDKVTISGATVAANGIPASELNASHTVSDVGLDGYRITVSTNATSSGFGATDSAVYATENKDINSMFINTQELVFNNTAIDYDAKLTTNNYVVDANYNPVFANQTVDNTADEYIIASSINETTSLAGAKSFNLRATLSSTQENLSPVIDMARASVITIGNIVNNDTTNETTSLGAAYAKYMTKRINLTSSATALRVMFAGKRPNDCTFAVYYKTIRDDDHTSLFENLAWVLMTEDGTTTADENNYKDYSYTADSLAPYTTFAVKIVMLSSTIAKVPSIKDFRAIALGT